MNAPLICLTFLATWVACAPAERIRVPPQTPLPDWEWRHYLGDRARSHFSPLRQIHRGNVTDLEVAWTYDTGELESALSEMQCNPIVVEGVLYLTTPQAEVVALEAATGREVWRFDPLEHGGQVQLKSRGVTWAATDTGSRIYVSSGPDLWALDAKSGEPASDFGQKGRIDLRAGLAHGSESRFVSATTPGVVYRDLLILGTRVSEDAGAAPGDVRAYDLDSGEIRWIFHTIPQPGDFGAESWPADAWRSHGGANSWAGLTLDAERGIVFVPTGSATPDFWGGERPGDNLFANSLLALDAATGERRWHFQFVHHDLWDRDLPAPPNLVTLTREGRSIDAVAQTTKSGHVFVFERESGAPVFPIEERPVPGGSVPGEWVSPTQPHPTAPPPFTRQGFRLEMLDERGEGFRNEQLKRIAGARMGENFIPPSLEGSLMFPGYDGGAEWGGAAWDEETGLLYVNANEVGALLQLMEPPRDFNPRSLYLEKCALCHGVDLDGTGAGPSLRGVMERRTTTAIYTAIVLGGGRMPGFPEIPLPLIGRLLAYLGNPDDPDTALAALDAMPGNRAPYVSTGYVYLRDAEGVPVTTPPWGTLSAIDLARGEIRWQVPLGEYPHLVEPGREATGSENYGGPVVTAGGLLFIAATVDEKLRAFDKRTGKLLWETKLPAAGYATPATYSAGGRQFVVVAAGGGKLGTKPGSKYVAFALPLD